MYVSMALREGVKRWLDSQKPVSQPASTMTEELHHEIQNSLKKNHNAHTHGPVPSASPSFSSVYYCQQ